MLSVWKHSTPSFFTSQGLGSSSTRREAIRLLVEELDPLGIYLFGSGAQGLLTPESDLDLAILGSKPYPPEHLFALRAPLSLLVGREVDLIDLRQAPLPLQAQVAAFGEPLYRKSLEADRFLDLALKAYARLNEERAEILGDIQKRGKVYG
ncbi:type VII toxin-antitoxin system MntA family adenylyltransferase antitoxin [Thermus scotoductus]|uniref:type VII toxin-antitoxin system MntA family adenylyltransferase antitoxin n=1 Tax=Thermus scotoductus TaxID=37636 RepID=UPI001561FDFD